MLRPERARAVVRELLPELRALRHALHREPELAGEERGTAARIREALARHAPDRTLGGLGGHGVAFAFDGPEPGPTALFRAELDALPITETGDVPHRSACEGVAHVCGHDGHMTILAALGGVLAAGRPERGHVVLLFQPAEETGAGARAVVDDPRFAAIRPDWAFAIHNLPGCPLGAVVVGPGPFNCASRGMVVRLRGATAHAAHPEDGRSPAAAMCALIEGLTALPRPAGGFQLVTVVHARLGEAAFGTAPGDAAVLATLRAGDDRALATLSERAVALVAEAAQRAGIAHRIEWRDEFPAVVNDPAAAALVDAAATALDYPRHALPQPVRWSEDFGRIAACGRGALLGLGAGERSPGLHRADYDFPDALIERGALLFAELARRALRA